MQDSDVDDEVGMAVDVVGTEIDELAMTLGGVTLAATPTPVKGGDAATHAPITTHAPAHIATATGMPVSPKEPTAMPASPAEATTVPASPTDRATASAATATTSATSKLGTGMWTIPYHAMWTAAA